MELCVGLSGLRLFYVGNVLQNRRSALSLAWHEWFPCKGKEWKVYCCGLALSSEPQRWKFHVVIWQTTSNIAPKSVAHVQHDYFSSFNQSNRSFVPLSLPLLSSFLKLPIIGSLSNHDDDGNKYPTNLHIWQWRTVFLHPLQVHISSFDILKTFSFFLRSEMTSFAVLWTKWAYDDKCSILSSYVPSAGFNLIPG